MAPLYRRRRIVQELHVSRGRRPRSVAGCHDEVDMQRPVDVADQVAEKDERSLEQAQDQHVVIGRVVPGDLAGHFANATLDVLCAEHDALEFPAARSCQQAFFRQVRRTGLNVFTHVSVRTPAENLRIRRARPSRPWPAPAPTGRFPSYRPGPEHGSAHGREPSDRRTTG